MSTATVQAPAVAGYGPSSRSFTAWRERRRAARVRRFGSAVAAVASAASTALSATPAARTLGRTRTALLLAAGALVGALLLGAALACRSLARTA